MHLSAPNSPYLTWLFLFLFINLFSLSLSDSDPRISQAGFFCDPIRAPGISSIPTFTGLMQNIVQLVNNNTWGVYHLNISNTTAQMYGLAQCYQDLTNTDCQLCFAAGRNTLPSCLPAISGRIYLDGCFIRYDNYSFFNESTSPSDDNVNCSSSYGQAIGNRALEFNQSVGLMIDNVTKAALSNGGFAIGEVNGVFGLAQCWKNLTNDGCRECLEKASREVIGRCLPNREGRALNVGCYLRYSPVKFYNDGERHGGSGLSTAATIAIALSGGCLHHALTLCCLCRLHEMVKIQTKAQ
ncbi:hypothetical protein F0562_004610 [Nyssa sinensis]|uniref:Gnk2-homologous domain-containing protein n=1 Tax=Nyssa sinensis TaxID=561372 RepID=A0A5J5BYX7_9ASTE|nr:hypothetical protein F0562_004610 [Nyssa sinensis]